MEVRRSAQIVIEPDSDLMATIRCFTKVCNDVSRIGWNEGDYLRAIALHNAAYHPVKGRLSSQLTCSAIRIVAGAYASARAKKRPIMKEPAKFRRPFAFFLVGKRGRDAGFRDDGTLSIWTVAGRKHLRYSVPDYFKGVLEKNKGIDSIAVRVRGGKVTALVALTIDVPDAQGILPVGADLNETNALVAVDADNHVLFVSGLTRRVKNKRNRKTIRRLQKRLGFRKAEHKSTKSAARVLKRLQGKQARRTRDFCHTAAKKLVEFAPQNCVLVFEDLNFGQGGRGSSAWNRRFHSWPRGMLLAFAKYKVEGKGQVAFVNPRGTSQACSRCGLKGVRSRHRFSCSHCGFSSHADVNAAVNVRNRYTSFRAGGFPSMNPEASSGGKLPAQVGGS